MFRFTTHCLLLLTVVCSQVLSGVSCCCLARSLTAGSRVEATTPDAAQAPRCSKCAAHRQSASTKVIGHKVPCPSGDLQSHGSTCSCSKLPLIASQSDDQVPPVSISAWIVPAFSASSASSLTLSSIDRYELPSRFGGETWQSIACIWRN